ncbi:MAG: hypothetical protein K2H13_03335 [Eubacterium sp.]|nr:hypothetical protein [Eubacterium sp.]MDE6154856.1 hypothetical protein [Eubacterium sp.]
MINESYERLAVLFEQLGISAVSGSEDKGELMAYRAGIELVQNELEDGFNQLFVDTAFGIGLSQLCEMFKIDGMLSDEEKKLQIAEGFAEIYGNYVCGDFEKELDKQCPMLSAVPLDFYITINGSVKNDYDQLAKLGRILENYMPPCTVVEFGGNGFNFDYWDSTPYLFEDYDNFNLNFELLDELM